MMQAVLFLAALVVLLAAFTGFAFLARSFQRAFFCVDPRFFSDETSRVLWICAIWALTDFLLRVWLSRRYLRGADEPKRRARAVRWNLVSAGACFAVILLVGVLGNWRYESAAESFFQNGERCAPTFGYYWQAYTLFHLPSFSANRFWILEAILLGVLALGAARFVRRIVQTRRTRRTNAGDAASAPNEAPCVSAKKNPCFLAGVLERARSFLRRLVRLLLARPWSCLLGYWLAFDLFFCLKSFCEQLIFFRFYLPLLHFIYYAKITPRGILGITALALVFVNIAWMCWRAKERCDDKRKFIR